MIVSYLLGVFIVINSIQ